ncbi:DNA modification methylase [Leucobacter aridicollis]|nr:DNA modification methylase [Leucobacter aridicollis]
MLRARTFQFIHGSEALLKNRIAASLALAAALTLGMSGCSLIAHNATGVEYAPSDGVQVTSEGVALRNIMLVADEAGENFNLVFTAVNETGAPANVSVSMKSESADATIDFVAPEGTTSFGNPNTDDELLVTPLEGLQAGQTVKSYFTINGTGDLVEYVPLLDGTLKEYQAYVLPEGAGAVSEASIADLAKMTEEEIAAAAKEAGETVEEFTTRVAAEAAEALTNQAG